MYFKIKSCFCITVFLSALFPSMAQAQFESAQKTIEIIREEHPALQVETALFKALEEGQVEGQRFRDKLGMKAFYEARGYEEAWLQSSFLGQPKANKILKVLEEAWRHGLNPQNYHVDEIRTLMDRNDQKENFKLDLVLSDALVRYGQDLSGMRVNPKSIGQSAKYWRTPLHAEDILRHVADTTDTNAALYGLAPQGKLYKTLQSELERLYKINASENQYDPIRVKGILRPGSSNKSILAIRKRMGFAADDSFEGVYYYDDQLAQSVMAFQKAHGLTPDGIIGPHTVKLMNMTSEDSINQILVNLERLRWVEPEKPSRYVMVNVPSAMLWAIEDNQVELEMPVVVGREKRPTNIFSTNITGIRFNPRWTVPPTIKRDDYLPKLREDPYYLTDRGIELVDKDNMTVDPGLVDWNQATWSDVNNMRMVQGSGSANPLGLVRVIMENPYNIYLHDTPSKSYFKRTDRALSSGCIRMSEPQKLADFVLSHNNGWSEDRKNQILANGRQTDIRADEPLPVYILYQTVWLGDNGQIVYGHDIYGHDAKLLKELKNINGVAIPAMDSGVKTAKSSINS